MLRKSPTSNAWGAIFENTDFSWSSLKVTKLSKLAYFFFLLKILFCLHYLLMVVPSTSVRLKDGNVEIKENKEVKV